jgi:hypothetical protein
MSHQYGFDLQLTNDDDDEDDELWVQPDSQIHPQLFLLRST